MSNEVNVALAQIDCRVGDKDYNIDKIEQRAEDAGKRNANIVIFPELSLTGYSVRDLAYELAEPVPGPSVKLLERIAEKEEMYMVCGMLERSGKARAILYNTAILLGPKGYIGKYRKMHLPTHSVFEEKRYFRHKDSEYFLDFVSPPLSVGSEPVSMIAEIKELLQKKNYIMEYYL